MAENQKHPHLYPKPDTHRMRTVRARYNSRTDWKYDTKGYFLIKVDRRNKRILAGHCRRSNAIEVCVAGRHPEEIYNTVVRLGLIGRQEHAAYLGMELQKAYTALQLGIEYVQDSPLDYRRKAGNANIRRKMG